MEPTETLEPSKDIDTAAQEAIASGDAITSDKGDATGQAVAGVDGQPAVPVWDGKEYAIKFRDKEIVPKDKAHLITLAQKGYLYDNRVGEMKTREESLQQQEAKLAKLQQLNEAFEKNPKLQQRIFSLYQEVLSGKAEAEQAGDAATAEGNADIAAKLKEMFAPLQSKVQELESFRQTWIQRDADDWAKHQISDMREKHPEHDWDAVDSESGKPLWKTVVDIAVKKGLTDNLDDAYRLFFFDHVGQSAAADALKKQAEKEAEDRKRGVITTGSTGKTPKQGVVPDTRGKTYDQVAAEALSAWTKT